MSEWESARGNNMHASVKFHKVNINEKKLMRGWQKESSIKHGNSLAIKITHSIASMHLKCELIKAINKRVSVKHMKCELSPSNLFIYASPCLWELIYLYHYHYLERGFKFYFIVVSILQNRSHLKVKFQLPSDEYPKFMCQGTFSNHVVHKICQIILIDCAR